MQLIKPRVSYTESLAIIVHKDDARLFHIDPMFLGHYWAPWNGPKWSFHYVYYSET